MKNKSKIIISIAALATLAVGTIFYKKVLSQPKLKSVMRPKLHSNINRHRSQVRNKRSAA